MSTRTKPLLQLLIFSLDGTRYALRVSAVERVERAVEVTPVPGTPPMVVGVINVQGRIIPVLDIRRRLGLRQREIDIDDYLIVARTARRAVALVANTAGELICTEEPILRADEIIPGLENVGGVIKLSNGLVYVHDLERFLSLEEEKVLDEALEHRAGRA